MSKKTQVSFRLPITLKKLITKYVENGLYINESDFIRSAIREKLRKDAPALYTPQWRDE